MASARGDGVEALANAAAAEIGRILRSQGGGAAALTEVFLDRIAGQTSPIFLAVTADRARAEARAADERLAAGRPLSALDGVPIAWKDLVDIAGARTTAASAIYRDVDPATADAPVVRNAARAGMVTLGKLNLAEFAYSALGQNPHFGTPQNAAAGEDRVPGGSSSGSAAAVAAGLAPVAIGSDTAGSVRIPASFCGVVGYKCSVGRIPLAGVFALSRTQDTLGPLGRSVEDCALTAAALSGAPDRSPTAISVEGAEILAPEGMFTAELDDAVAAAFDASLHRLEAAGARIRRAPLPALDDAARMLRDLGSIVAADAFTEHQAVMDGPDAERMDQRVRARIEIGRRMSARDLTRLLRQRERGAAEIAAVLGDGYLASPTTPGVAPRLSDFEGDDDAFMALNNRANRNTSIGSFYDMPGLSIPNGRDAAGAPTSFLLSAAHGRDAGLLARGMGAENAIRHDRE